MNAREVAVVAVVVLGVAGATLPAVTAAAETETATPLDETNATATGPNGTADESGNDSAAFGTQLTAFMQSSAAETNDTVESGMWQARFDRANESEQARLAQKRTGSLEQRFEGLRERNRTLTEQYENESISRATYVAEASKLSGRMAALRASINDTERAAGDVGTNDTRLNELRNDAKNMTGPEVAGLARGIAAGDRGPPADVTPGNSVNAGPRNNPTNVSVGDGNGDGPPNQTDRDGTKGGGNADPRDGGVGTGPNQRASGDDSANRSSGNDDRGNDAKNSPGDAGNGNSGDDTSSSENGPDAREPSGNGPDKGDPSGNGPDAKDPSGNGPDEGGPSGNGPDGDHSNDKTWLLDGIFAW